MIHGNHFVGRCSELESFAALVDRFPHDAGQLVVVSGHAGIGKTALARRMSDSAARQGMRSYWSAFPEQADCPPYRGWTGLCREIATDHPDSEAQALADLMAASADDRAGVSPWQLFDRLTRLMRAAGAERPVALFFDDVLHADRASLDLLQLLATELYHLPVLLVATFRENDVSASAKRTRAVPEIATLPQAQRIVVRGLDELECAHLCIEMTGWSPDVRIARSLHRQTEGNPLFLRHILQSLVNDGHIVDGQATIPPRLSVPEGITEAIEMQFNAASVACRRLLEKAAVIGRVFDIAVLRRLHPGLETHLLDEAFRLGLAQPAEASTGRWQFSHALVREVLYDRVPPMQRLRCHADAAEAVEAIFGAHDPQTLATLAHHAFEGQIFAGALRAIRLACMAGHSAMSVAAYEDAAIQFRLAYDCFSIPGVNDEAGQLDTCLHLAAAQHAGGDNIASMRSSRIAIALARKQEDWPRFASAAVAYEDARWQPGLPAEEGAEYLEQALAHAEGLSEPVIVRLYYCLGRALLKLGRLDEARVHAIEAIDRARAFQDGRDLCDAIEAGCQVLSVQTGSHAMRIALTAEALEIARGLSDPVRLANALVSYGYGCATAGDWTTFRELHRELQQVSRDLAQPHFLYVAQTWTTTLALLDGDFNAASASAQRARTLGARVSGSGGDGLYGTVMFLIQRERGTLMEFARLADQMKAAKGDRVWKPGLALMWAEIDRMAEAAGMLDRIEREGAATIAWDDMRRLTLAMLAETCWRTGNTKLARHLFDQLLPEQGLVILNGPVSACFGPVDRALGQLKACMRNFDEAQCWFEKALKQTIGWGSGPSYVRVACEYCEVLLADGSPKAVRRARELEAEFGAIARPLGMQAIADRFDRVGGELRRIASSHGFDKLTAREVEVLREVARGASNADISRSLAIALPTVATHLRNILAKIDCRNRTAAAAYARQVGLVEHETLA